MKVCKGLKLHNLIISLMDFFIKCLIQVKQKQGVDSRSAKELLILCCPLNVRGNYLHRETFHVLNEKNEMHITRKLGLEAREKLNMKI